MLLLAAMLGVSRLAAMLGVGCLTAVLSSSRLEHAHRCHLHPEVRKGDIWWVGLWNCVCVHACVCTYTDFTCTKSVSERA